MPRYKIEILGDSRDPSAYYSVEAENEDTALMMAVLVDQYSPVRPTDPRQPQFVCQEIETSLAKAHGRVVAVSHETSQSISQKDERKNDAFPPAATTRTGQLG